LAFGAGISPSDVTVSGDALGDLILSLDANDRITLQNATQAALGLGVQQVTFADGTIWTYAQMTSMATTGSPTNTNLYGTGGSEVFDSQGYANFEYGGGGGDTFVYDPGYGPLQIDENDFSPDPDNVLQFGQGILPTDITVSSDSDEDLILTLNDGMGDDSITIDDGINAASGVYTDLNGQFVEQTDGVQGIEFANGDTWTAAQILSVLSTPTPGPNLLISDADNYVFDGLGGDDVEISTGNSETFIFNQGYGQLEIDADPDNGSATQDNDVLVLGPGITPSDVTVVKDNTTYGFDLLIGTNGDRIKVDTGLSPTAGIHTIKFADGTVWTDAQIFANFEVLGTTGNDILQGDDSPLTLQYGEVFDGRGGNDTVDGYSGNDRFIFNVGYGTLSIDEYDWYGTNTSSLIFGPGITPSDITAVQDSSGNGNLDLFVGNNGDEVVLMDFFFGGVPSHTAAQYVFSDGTVWTWQQLISSIYVEGTPGNDYLTGVYFAGQTYGEVFDGKGGNDVAVGYSGNDTFIFNQGYGTLTVEEYNPIAAVPDNILKLGPGITPGDVTIYDDRNEDVVLDIGNNGDKVILQTMLVSPDFSAQEVQFADGTIWDRQQILSMLHVLGTTGDDYLQGSYVGGADAYAEVFNGLGGNDTEVGFSGIDTFIYDSGYGLLTIEEIDTNFTPNSTLAFGPGIAPSSVTATTDASGDLILTLDANDQITIQNALSSGDGTTYGVQRATFADGTVWDFGYATGGTLAATSGSTVAYYAVDNTTINLITGTAIANGMSSGDTLIGISNVVVIGNGDTITGVVNSTVTVDGSDDITTEGIWSTVIIDGTSDQDAAGTGTRVTINGSDNIENGGSFVAVTDNGAEDQTTAGSSSNLNVIGNSDTLTAGANSTVTVSGSNDVTTEGIWSTVVIDGTGDQDAGATGTRVTINGLDNIENGGSFLAVADNGTGDQTTAGSSSSLNVIGNSDTLTTGANSTVTVSGSNDVTTEGIWSTVTIGGTDDQDAAGTGTRVTINGSDNIENGGSFVAVADNGTDDQTTAGSSSNLNAIGNSDTLTAGANSTVTVSGSNDITAEGIWSPVTIDGTSNQDAAGTGTRVTINGSDNIENGGSFLTVTDNGTEDQTTAGSSSNLNAIGNSDMLTAGANSTVTVSGSNDVTTEGIWSTVTIGGTGDQDAAGTGTRITINGSDNTENGGTFLTVTDNGTDDQTTAGSASNLTVVGNNDTANVGGDSAATVRGDNDTVTVLASGDNTNMTFLGTADVASVDGANAAITDNGSGLHINIGSAGGRHIPEQSRERPNGSNRLAGRRRRLYQYGASVERSCQRRPWRHAAVSGIIGKPRLYQSSVDGTDRNKLSNWITVPAVATSHHHVTPRHTRRRPSAAGAQAGREAAPVLFQISVLHTRTVPAPVWPERPALALTTREQQKFCGEQPQPRPDVPSWYMAPQQPVALADHIGVIDPVDNPFRPHAPVAELAPKAARKTEPRNTRNTQKTAVPYWVRTMRLISSRGLPNLKPEAFG